MMRHECRNRLGTSASSAISIAIVIIIYNVSLIQLSLAQYPDVKNNTAQRARTPLCVNLESWGHYGCSEKTYVFTTNATSSTPKHPRSQRFSVRKHNSTPHVVQVHTSASRVDSPLPLTPKCTGLKQTEPCWQRVEDDPECFVWNRYYVPEQTVTWSGGCSSGRATGNGTLIWTIDDLSEEEVGLLDHGIKQLQWTIRHSDGTVSEGRYVDGYRHGRWTTQYPGGRTAGGSYVHGYRSGHWVQHTLDGAIAEGPFLQGKRHGRWRIQMLSGVVVEGPFVHGTRQGWWIEKDASGNVYEGPYADGGMHGIWTKTATNGAVFEGPYANNLMHGWWIERHPDGGVVEGVMENGKKVGRWITRYADGTTLEGDHLDGKQHGVWIIRYADGTISELEFVHGELQE